MRNGPFLISDPIGLTLSSRSFRTPESPDLVWQLTLQEDRAIELRSNLNLQAQSFLLFPSFRFGGKTVLTLKEFLSLPRIDSVLQDYLEITGNPTEAIQLRLEFYADSNRSLICRSSFTNLSAERQEIEMSLNAELSPMGQFSPMAATRIGHRTVLKAETGKLSLAIHSETEAKALLSPLPGLQWKRFIEANQSLVLFWRIQASEKPTQLAQDLEAPLPSNWEAQISRLRMEDHNRSMQIICEDPDWQLVFDNSLRQAQALINQDKEGLQVYKMRNPASSLLSQAKMEGFGLGFVEAEPLHIYQLSLCLLPSDPLLVQKMLSQYLEKLQTQWHGQSLKNGETLPLPVLAGLAWRVFKHNLDKGFIEAYYPFLRDLSFAWFDQAADRDFDGLPEWESNTQTGLNKLAGFDLLDEEGFAPRLQTAENTGLAALLELELEAIALMAHLLDDMATEAIVQSLKNRLSTSLEAWLSENRSFGFRHYKTHAHPDGELLYEGSLPLSKGIAKTLISPNQICLQLRAENLTGKPSGLIVSGKDLNGNPLSETLGREKILWLPGLMFAQTEAVFSVLDEVNLEPAASQFSARIYAPAYSQRSIMQLLTLFPDEESAALDLAITENLGFTPASLRYGVPENLSKDAAEDERINLGWNGLLLENLIKNNQKQTAFELFSRLVLPLKTSLRQNHRLYEAYDAKTGRGRGNQNHIAGLLPLELLLDIAGIRVLSAEKVMILGDNGLPWPITLRFQGLELKRDGKNSQITFADGSSFHHYGSSLKTFSPPKAAEL